MRFEWIVQVKTAGSVPVPSVAVSAASVALVPESALAGQAWPYSSSAATHTHQSGGRYEQSVPSAPAEGKWFLIVSAPGMNPVLQTLDVSKSKQALPKGDLVPRLTHQVAVVSMKSVVDVKAEVRTTTFEVTLHPAMELVFLTGTEYENAGTQFRIFAESYQKKLHAAKKLHDGVVITLFSTDHRARDTFVPGFGGGWVKVGSLSYGSATAIRPGRRHDPLVGEDVSITHFYEYLSGVGATAPGRVLEAGVFSHAWVGGPILFNTGDASTTTRRDPDDFDGRTKDFSPVNVSSWPNLKKAFGPTGRYRVWGCSATTHYKNLALAARANKKQPDDYFFVVRTEVKSHSGAVVYEDEERTTRSRIRVLMDSQFRSNSYSASAAQFLGIPVFAAAPGAGASYGNNLMFIDTTAYAALYAYFQDEFGPEFLPTSQPFDKGYVDYHAIAKRPAPVVPKFAPQYYTLRKDHSSSPKTVVLALEDGNDYLQEDEAAGEKVVFKTQSQTGLVATTLGGVVYELELLDRSGKSRRSRAIYVQDDGKVYSATRGAGKSWVAGSPVIP